MERKSRIPCPFCHRMMSIEYSYCPTCGKFVQSAEGEPTSLRSLIFRAFGWFCIMILLIFFLIYLQHKP